MGATAPTAIVGVGAVDGAGKATALNVGANGGLVIEGVASGTTVPVTASIAPAKIASAANTGTCTTVTSTSNLIASNTSRASVTFQAPTSNTKNVRWSKDATATASQMVLPPGQIIMLDGAGGSVYVGPISFISEDGSSQTVCVTEDNHP